MVTIRLPTTREPPLSTLSPFTSINPATLADLEQQTYQAMVAQYGLTLEEAGEALRDHKVTLAAATAKLQRAHQQAAMALASRLDQLAKAKRAQ
jgi:hypothetical protein